LIHLIQLKSVLLIFKPDKRIILFLILFSCSRLTAADYYWVGGTGNWSDISHWATTSGGGTMHFTTPSAADNVHFDANSFTSSGQTVTVNTNAVCNDINWTGATNNPTFRCTTSYNLRIYGSVTLIPAMTFTVTGKVYFEATTTGKTITSAGKSYGTYVYFQGTGGGWTLLDSFTCADSIILNYGSLNANSNKIKCYFFNSDNTNTRVLDISNSIVETNSWKINGTNLTFNTANSLIKIINSNYNFHHNGTPKTYNNIQITGLFEIDIYGGGSSYNVITHTGSPYSSARMNLNDNNKIDSLISAVDVYLYNGDSINFLSSKIGAYISVSGLNRHIIHNAIINGSCDIFGMNVIDNIVVGGDVKLYNSNTFGSAKFLGNGNFSGGHSFDTLALSPGKSYTIESNTTQTINRSLNINGRCTGYIIIQSSVAGTNATFTKSSGNVSGNYVILKDIRATGGASFTANNSIDLGNNPGWTFTTPSLLDLFWVGGSGNWSDSSHWSFISGGAGGACIPNPSNNVFFDSNSFSTSGQTVTINTNGFCRNINWTGALFNPAFNCNNYNSLRIYGSLTLIRAMNLSFSNGTVYFEATTTGKTITSAGKSFGNFVYFQGSGGGWTLLDSFSSADSIIFNYGSLYTNSNKIKCINFNSDNTNTRSLDISNSVIETSDWKINGTNLSFYASNSLIKIMNSWFGFYHNGTAKAYNNIQIISPTSTTIDGGGSTFNVITRTGTASSVTRLSINGNNKIDSLISYVNLTIHNNDSINFLWTQKGADIGSGISRHVIQEAVINGYCIISGFNTINNIIIGDDAQLNNNTTFSYAKFLGNGIFLGVHTFDTLILNVGKNYILESNNTQTINRNLNINGNCSGYIYIQSSIPGSNATISKSTGNVTGNNLILRNIMATGGASYTANNSIDLGSNPGWTFNSPSLSDLFWVGGSGNWSDSSHWSYSSGGSGGACNPNPSSNVFFDSNSFSAIGQTVTMNTNAFCRNMNWTGVRFNPGFVCNSYISLKIYGSVTLIQAMNFSFSKSTVYFEATSTGKNITSAGKSFGNNVYFQGIGGGWTLLDNFTCPDSIVLKYGSLYANSHKIQCDFFFSEYTNTRSLDISNSVVETDAWRISGTNLSFNAANSLINIVNSARDIRHTGTPKTYNNILITPYYSGTISIYGGGSTFNMITHTGSSSNFAKLIINDNNKIDSIISGVNLYIYNDDSINFLWAQKGVDLGTVASHRHVIRKAVVNGYCNIYGMNIIKDIIIGGDAQLYHSTTFGSAKFLGNANISGGHYFDTLTFSPGKTYILESNFTQTINRQLNIRGNNCFPISVKSGSIGSLATISKTSGKVLGDFLELRDIRATGGATYYAGSNSSNLGNNTGWNFNNAPGYIYGLGIDTSLCKGSILSTENFNGGISFYWQDSSTSPYFKVEKPGTYWVKASFGQGCTYTDSITIFSLKPNPKAGFVTNSNFQCLNGNSIKFSDTSSIDSGSIVSYKWYYGDGKTDSIQNPSHNYNLADTFNIKMVTVSDLGCQDSVQKSLFVYNPPQSGFLVNDSVQCLSGNNFIFSNKTLNPPNSTTLFTWYFGDGTRDTATNTNHSYLKSDTFSVSLLALSNLGCKDSVMKNIFVLPKPIALFALFDSSQCLERNDFGFVNKSKTSTGNLSYLWNFGDSSTSILMNPHHQYTNSDTFTVLLKVTSQNGCYDTFVKHAFLHVHPEPLADFQINDTIQCFKANTFNFTNTTALKSGSFKQFWDFNDGSTSDSLNSSHTYSTIDTFTTKLLIISDWNCKDSVFKKVYVYPMPNADFTINTNPQPLGGNNFQFTNNSSISFGTLSSLWNFGDGNTSVQTNSSHSYITPDTFNVMLTSVSSEGCADSIMKQVFVQISVIVDFTAKGVCLGDTVYFKSFCNAYPDSFRNYLWNYGDGTDAIVWDDPKHLYADTGTYIVTMVGLTYLGYKNSATKSITILPRPSVSISYDKDTAFYPGGSTILTANGTFKSILWSTGETKTDILVREAGNYIARVLGSNGCDASDSIRIYLLEMIPFNAMNVMTPNDDGYNDVWKVFNIDQYKPCKLGIYNRWGDELYSSSDYQNDWNGTYKGKKLPEGTYYYYFQTKDGVVYKGAINILK
jgi:gliding motility-associated-like protein